MCAISFVALSDPSCHGSLPETASISIPVATAPVYHHRPVCTAHTRLWIAGSAPYLVV